MECMSDTQQFVLVTGGAGYLGSQVVANLLHRRYRVRVLDEMLHGSGAIADLACNASLEVARADLRDLKSLMKAVRGVDAVIHLAAVVGDPACGLDRESTIAINGLATAALVECARYFGVRRFLFASTCSVYGASEVACNEDSALRPVSLYAESKARSEETVLQAANECFSPTVLRKATLYGVSRRMRFDLVVNLLAAKAVSENSIPVFGGDQWRPFLHVRDAAAAYIACLEAPIDRVAAQIFNLAATNLQLIDVGRLVKRVVPEATLHVRKDVKDIRNYHVEATKIVRQVGFVPTCDLIGGIQEVTAALRRGQFGPYSSVEYNNFLGDVQDYYRKILKFDSPDKL